MKKEYFVLMIIKTIKTIFIFIIVLFGVAFLIKILINGEYFVFAALIPVFLLALSGYFTFKAVTDPRCKVCGAELPMKYISIGGYYRGRCPECEAGRKTKKSKNKLGHL